MHTSIIFIVQNYLPLLCKNVLEDVPAGLVSCDGSLFSTASNRALIRLMLSIGKHPDGVRSSRAFLKALSETLLSPQDC